MYKWELASSENRCGWMFCSWGEYGTAEYLKQYSKFYVNFLSIINFHPGCEKREKKKERNRILLLVFIVDCVTLWSYSEKAEMIQCSPYKSLAFSGESADVFGIYALLRHMNHLYPRVKSEIYIQCCFQGFYNTNLPLLPSVLSSLNGGNKLETRIYFPTYTRGKSEELGLSNSTKYRKMSCIKKKKKKNSFRGLES